MARFQQTPLLTPVDYGFKMPFQEIMGTLQRKQQQQDTAVAQLEELRAKDMKAKQQDFAVRGRIRDDRYGRIDKIMLDDSGNLQDLTGASGLIRAEARRQAKEEQVGGVVWALETSYDLDQKHEAELQKMWEKGDISKDRREWLRDESERRYKGIGEKDEYGHADLYQGITAAKEFDEFTLADTAIKGWKSNKIQISKGPQGELDLSPTKEYINALRAKNPDYAKILDGDRYQTGELEYVLIDDLMAHGTNVLQNNTQLMQDLAQEAQQYGARTSEEVQAYMQQKVHDAALTAAEKYSFAHFTPKSFDNWRKKKQVDWYYKKKAIDYEAARNMRIMQVQTDMTQRKVPVRSLFDNRKKAQEAVAGLEEKLKQYRNADNSTKQAILNNPVRLKEYQELEAQYRRANNEVQKANKILINQAGGSGVDFKQSIHEKVGGVFEQYFKSMGIYENDPRYQKAKDLYTEHVYGYLNSKTNEELGEFIIGGNFIPEELTAGMAAVTDLLSLNTGTGLQYDDPTTGETRWVLPGQLEAEKEGRLTEFMAEHKKANVESLTNSIARGLESLGKETTQKIEGKIRELEAAGGSIPFEQSYTGMYSYSGTGKDFTGEFGAYAKAATNALNLGQGTWTDPITGQRMDPKATLKSMGVDLSTAVAIPARERDPVTGEPIFIYTAKYPKDHKRAGEVVEIAIAAEAGSHNSFDQNEMGIAFNMIESAEAKSSKVQARQDHETGMEKIGRIKYQRAIASSGLLHAPPNSTMIIDNKYALTYTDEKHWVISPAVLSDTGGYIADKSNYFTDFRKYSNNRENFVFKDINTIYQLLGEASYNRERKHSR